MTIEIRQLLSGRVRKILLVLIPLLVVAATLGAVSEQPPEYQAVAELMIPPDRADSGGAAALYVANFTVKLDSAEVMTPVATQFGMTMPELLEAIALERVEQSSVLRVSATAGSAITADQIATSSARAAAAALAQDAVNEARRAADSAVARYGETQLALDQKLAEQGIGDPLLLVQSQELLVSDLRRQVTAAEAAGSVSASLRASLETQTAELTKRRNVIRETEALNASLLASQEQRNNAQRSLVQSQTALDQTSAESFAQLRSLKKVSSLTRLVQAGVLAAIVAVALYLSVLVAIEANRRRRARKRLRRLAKTAPVESAEGESAEGENDPTKNGSSTTDSTITVAEKS